MAAAIKKVQQRMCGYTRESMENGETYVAEQFAMKLVMRNLIEDALKIHAAGNARVSPVLEYSAKRGRHQMTQALLAAGVTVTNAAIQGAAKLGGPGVDLLLAGVIEGEPLEMAQHDALYARIFYGEFDRAITMLEQGVKPSEICYHALDVGSKRGRVSDLEATERAHRLLDAMIPVTPVEQFTSSALQGFLPVARPLHIERTLEAINRPPSFLLLPALEEKAFEATQILRQLGMRVDDATFATLRDELLDRKFVHKRVLESLLDEYMMDNGQAMSAELIAPVLRHVLQENDYALCSRITGPNEDSYERANEVLLPYLRFMDPAEHMKVFPIIDRWAATSRMSVHPHVIAVLKHTVQITNQLAVAQLTHESPSP